jgi:membrane protease subunit (stomatin/prohibitin family)
MEDAVGFFDHLKNEAATQFIEIIQWLDQTDDSLVYRFPIYNAEIKMGAQLTVRENQVALFVNEGKAADLFSPGLYTLSTQTIPILTVLRGWKYGFQSQFKADVYFFNTRLYPDQKWGTTNPVMMRDRDFGMIRLRAFGTYALRVKDAKTFFETIVGTRGLTTTSDIIGQLRSTILSKLSDAIAEANIPALDLAAKYDDLSAIAITKIGPEFAGYGLELARFYVENISLPEEVEAAIDQRTKLGVLGDRMQQYAQLQTAEAIPLAAANPGGIAGAGAGLGAGLAIGSTMGQAFGTGSQMAPPPLPGAAPPPAPGGAAMANAARWSLAIEGKTYGPYTDDTLRGMVQSGQVAPTTQAWRPGAAGWASLDQFPELGMAAPPPPPPPAPPKASGG